MITVSGRISKQMLFMVGAECRPVDPVANGGPLGEEASMLGSESPVILRSAAVSAKLKRLRLGAMKALEDR
jgi:hypothetical protein